VVNGDKGEVLVPAGTGVITDVRVDEGVMLVSLPEGLR
jgi:ribosomal 30S subunit maturation factor RimM